jgi:hypothetical protein
VPGPWVENKTMVLRRQAVHRRKQLEAGPFAAEVASFRLHLAAENKAAGTVRTYAEAALWFAAAYLLRETGRTRWDQVSARDVQQWTVRLLGLYSDAYGRNQFRALQQFFRWLAAEDGIPDPMARLRPPKETRKPVPSFTSVELSRLAKACRGSSFDERRDAAVIAVFLATGILTVSSERRVWFGKVTVKDEIRSSNRGGLMPAVSRESSMERMPEPRFSQTVRVSPGSGTSSSSLMRVALRAEEIPSSPRLSMVTGPNSPPGFLMTSRSGYIST